MSESDHNYALVVMLNESESTGDKLTFTVQKVNQADLDPDQTRVAIIENEGVQTKVALPASLVTPLNQLSTEGEDIANAYLQSVVLQSLESVAKSKPDVMEELETPSNDINIVLKEGVEETEHVGESEEDLEDSSVNEHKDRDQNKGTIFEDLSVIQSMLHNLKEKNNDAGDNPDDNENSETKIVDNTIETVQDEDIEMSDVITDVVDSLPGEVIHGEIEEIHKYSKVYKCGFCDATYTTKYSLNIHMRHHTGERPFKCTECDAEFVRRSYLKYHMQNHTGIKLYQCALCDMSYTSGSSLKNHIRTHTGEKPYKCSQCEEAFARKAYLNHHEIIAHQCALPYSCSQCDKVYKTKSSLRMHVKTHIAVDESHPNKCEICEKTFTRQHDLKRHISSVHEKKNLFKCELCDMSYTAKGSLVVHMRSHTGEKPFECDLCDAKFARNTYLRIHRMSHENKKPIECEICNTGFTVMSSLKQHMKRHKGEKQYSCDVCHAKFYRHRSAVEHKRVHTGEKPYRCQLCDKRFAWRCDMRRHAKAHSSEVETIHSCSECDITFSSKDLLNSHLKIHSGDKQNSNESNENNPKVDSVDKKEERLLEGKGDEVDIEVLYECEDCNKQFESGYSLKTHVESTHRNPDQAKESESEDNEIDFDNEGTKNMMDCTAAKLTSEVDETAESGEKQLQYDAKNNKDEKSKLAIITRGNLKSQKK